MKYLIYIYILLVLALPAAADIQSSIQTFCTPQDADQAKLAILDLINCARHNIRVFAYGFTDPDICDALVDAESRGVDVAMVMDSTEAAGAHQAPMVQQLERAGVRLAIGKSPVHHQLIHMKAIVVDGHVVESGSLNYSPSGFEQLNEVDIVESTERADKFGRAWRDEWNYLQAR